MARSPDLVRLLFSRDGHAIHSQSGASGRTAEFEVIADLGDVVEHLLEVAGDRDFLDREGKLTVLDPKATGPAGEVSGHQVHTEAEKFRNVEPGLDLGFGVNLVTGDFSRDRKSTRLNSSHT